VPAKTTCSHIRVDVGMVVGSGVLAAVNVVLRVICASQPLNRGASHRVSTFLSARSQASACRRRSENSELSHCASGSGHHVGGFGKLLAPECTMSSWDARSSNWSGSR
jgi:hypothetical protein